MEEKLTRHDQEARLEELNKTVEMPFVSNGGKSSRLLRGHLAAQGGRGSHLTGLEARL
jgi:hypothetical protein